MTKKQVFPLLDVKQKPERTQDVYGESLPQHGIAARDAIVYKKCHTRGKTGMTIWVIVKLLIRAGTRVFLTDTKCRAAEVEVISITMQGRATQLASARSSQEYDFTYSPGQIVKPRKPFSNRPYKCESGIHFFRTLAEARNY